MKLQKLTISNIASIEQAEIEFDKGALAEDPLFLITGRTGAGKTTILNAICLALYDQVPCLTGVKDDRAPDSELKISSPGQLMRKGAKKAEVTLTFESGGVFYLAVWEAHYSNRKTKGEHRNLLLSRSLTNIATGETLGKKNEINAAIRSAIGLTFEQFTRTTMLAQGQFAAFMRADEKDKADILEKLTGTGIYTGIGQSVYELMKEAEDRHDRIASEISGIKLLGDEDKQQLVEKSEQLTRTFTAVTLRISEIDKRLQWLITDRSLRRSLDQCNAEYDRATAVVAADTYKDKVKAIEKYDSTSEIRSLVGQAAEIEQKVAAATNSLESYGRETAMRIADGMCHMEKAIKAAHDNLMETDGKLAVLRPGSGVYADIQRIDEKASQLASLYKQCDDTDKLARQTEADKTESQNVEAPLKEKSDSLQKKISDLETEIHAVDKSMAGYDRAGLTSDKTSADAGILRINTTIQLLDTLGLRRSDLADAQGREKQNAEDIEKAQKELDDVETRLPVLMSEDEKCRAFLEGQKTIADHITQLRTLYAESHTCPLCGNPHAEILPDKTIGEMLEDARRRADAAGALLVDAKARRKSLKNDIAAKTRQAAVFAEEVKRKKALEKTAITQLAALGWENPDEISAGSLKEDAAVMESRAVEIGKRLSELDALTAERDKLYKKKEKAVNVKEKALEKLHRQQQKTVSLSEKLSQQQNSLKDMLASAEKILAELSTLTGTGLSADTYIDTVGRLKKEAALYVRLNEERERWAREEEAAEALLERCRGHYPEGASVYIRDYVPQPVELVNAEKEIKDYGNTLNRRSGEIESGKAQLAVVNSSIDSFFHGSTLTRDDLADIFAIPAQTVEQWRGEVKKANDDITRAEGALCEVRRQIAGHDEVRPEIEDGVTVDSLQADKDNAEKERDNAKEEKLRITARLAEDTRLQQACRDKIELLGEASAQLNEWKILNNVFGNKDGSRFRAIAQSYVLRALLSRANQYLSWLSSRYTLDCRDGSLAIDVIDLRHGNTVRNVSLLSGGEGFVVSLALALGLSAISKDKIDVDILFIDEGFGTLDHDTLETVIETLDSLHRRGGRRIGIISHVSQLAERIPTQIRLVPSGPSSSRVHIV